MWMNIESAPFKVIYIIVQIKPAAAPEKEERMKNVDEELYPEYYRKSSDHIKGSNEMTPEPFRIARILYITSKSTGVGLGIFVCPL